jgi:uncharacterized phage-associated protein
MMHSSVNVAKQLLKLSRDPVAADMTPMKLLKLVYIAHGWMLGLTGRALVSEDVEAWKYGPVIPELYREIREFKKDPVTELPQASKNPNLDDLEKHIVRQVYDIYGDLDGLKLSTLTHSVGTPWHQIWKGRREVIPNDLIASYYEGLAAADEEAKRTQV